MLTKPNTLMLSECIAYYLQLCEIKGLSLNTINGKSTNLSLFFKWCQNHGITEVSETTTEILDNYQAHLNQYQKPHNAENLCRATIRARLTSVKVFLRCLFQKNIIETNDFESFELPKLGRRLPKPVLSQKEVALIFEQVHIGDIKGVRDRAILETFYASGIRRFELSQLTIDDIDFDQHQLRVNQGKGHKDRYVPIANRACYWLYRYLKYARPKLAKEGCNSVLFVTNRGNAYRPTQLSEMVAKNIKLSGIRKTGACNQFRHAAATHMVDNGADIRHVQEFLGHADISTTQIYLHVSMTKLRAVYEKTHPAANMEH
ncbi:MAG: tyrosine-type recombinase/integrase [Enterobacterales bacterium]|nr:tyrosine-type recombinase/integrase [Enterobacterales bacterium]